MLTSIRGSVALEFNLLQSDNLVIMTASKGANSASLTYQRGPYTKELRDNQLEQHSNYIQLLSTEDAVVSTECAQFYRTTEINGVMAWLTHAMLSTCKPSIARWAPHARTIRRCYEELGDIMMTHGELVQAVDFAFELLDEEMNVLLHEPMARVRSLHDDIYIRTARAMDNLRVAYQLVAPKNAVPQNTVAYGFNKIV
jgi:hypothetical protein